jgi:hypothetical protein
MEAGWSGEEEKVQMRASITPARDVYASDMWKRLNRSRDMHLYDPELASYIVGKIWQVVVLPRFQHQNQRGA